MDASCRRTKPMIVPLCWLPSERAKNLRKKVLEVVAVDERLLVELKYSVAWVSKTIPRERVELGGRKGGHLCALPECG